MSTQKFELKTEIYRFHQNLELLRDFISLIDAYLIEKNAETLKSHSAELGVLILGGIKTGSLPKDIIKTKLGGNIKPNKLHKALEKILEAKIEFIKEDEGFSYKIDGETNSNRINTAIRKVSHAQQRANLLYNSALMNLTNSAELLFSQIFHKYYKFFPNAIESEDKTFTFEELKRFDTLTDLREFYISTKIELTLRGSFRNWLNALEKKPKISTAFLTPELEILIETFQRRNLIVHNGGIVNNIYLSNVSEKMKQGVALDNNLEPTRDYLEERIDIFERNCILVSAEVWKKLSNTDIERSEVLNDISFTHLQTKKWAISEALSYFVMNDEKTKSIYQSIGKLNYWLSKKRQGKWDNISKEAEKADFSDKSFRLQLGLASLNERNDEFFLLIPKALKAETINITELNEFPIFDEMRTDSRFEEYLLNQDKTNMEGSIFKDDKDKI